MEDSRSIMAWGDVTFGPVATLVSLVDRAALELAELRQVLADGGDGEPALSEAADVAILLHRLVGLLGDDLGLAVDRKMAINRARNWTMAGDGTGRHVADGDRDGN